MYVTGGKVVDAKVCDLLHSRVEGRLALVQASDIQYRASGKTDQSES